MSLYLYKDLSSTVVTVMGLLIGAKTIVQEAINLKTIILKLENVKIQINISKCLIDQILTILNTLRIYNYF